MNPRITQKLKYYGPCNYPERYNFFNELHALDKALVRKE